MKKILLLLCLLLCACSAQTDIKDYTVIYKNKEVYPGVSASKMSDALFDSNIQYSEKMERSKQSLSLLRSINLRIILLLELIILE